MFFSGLPEKANSGQVIWVALGRLFEPKKSFMDISLDQWFSTRGDFVPQATFGIAWIQFFIVTTRGGCSRHPESRGHDAANDPIRHRTALPWHGDVSSSCLSAPKVQLLPVETSCSAWSWSLLDLGTLWPNCDGDNCIHDCFINTCCVPELGPSQMLSSCPHSSPGSRS